MIRTTWSIKQTDNNDKQKLLDKNTTQDRNTANMKLTNKWRNNKQKSNTPTANNGILRTRSCAKWKSKQYYGNNNDTNGVVIVCIIKDKHQINKNEEQGQTKVAQRKHNTRQTNDNTGNDKQQTHTLWVITYKETRKQKTRPKSQTTKTYAQVTVQNETQIRLQRD